MRTCFCVKAAAVLAFFAVLLAALTARLSKMAILCQGGSAYFVYLH
jgi:hypothetical protein